MIQDKLLIIQFKRNRPDALKSIYQKYRLYLLKIAVAIMNDTYAAEDVVHDVFIKFAGSAKTLKISGNLKSYLRSCVLNQARNHIRTCTVRAHTSLENAGEISSDGQRPEQWVSLDEQSAKINESLASIPYEQREVISLHIFGQMKFREIAKMQNVTLKTVQSRYRYGLDKLRSLLNNEV